MICLYTGGGLVYTQEKKANNETGRLGIADFGNRDLCQVTMPANPAGPMPLTASLTVAQLYRI